MNQTLLAGAPDFVVRWPELPVSAPVIDLAGGGIGPLTFGCALEAASVFGRPTRFARSRDDYCELLYAGAGFQIDFDAGQLAYAAFFLAADELLPAPDITFCEVRLRGIGALTWASTPREAEALLGPPAAKDDDPDESVWSYERGPVVLELEFAATGKLKRVNVFPAAGEPAEG